MAAVGGNGLFQRLLSLLIQVLVLIQGIWSFSLLLLLSSPIYLCNGKVCTQEAACKGKEIHYESGAVGGIRKEWGLTCADSYQARLVELLCYAGLLVGGLLAGCLASRLGRKATLTIFQLLFGSAVLLAGLTAWKWLFVLSLGLSAVGTAGVSLSGLLLVVETVGGEERQWYLAIGLAVAGLGSALWAIGAVYISNWRVLCLIIAGISLAISPFLLWLPESPRFLSISGKFESARKTLQRISRYNHSPLFQEVLEGEKVLGFQEQSPVLPSSPKALSDTSKINFINTSHGTVTVTDSTPCTWRTAQWTDLLRLEGFRRKLLPVMMMWSSQMVAGYCVGKELRSTVGDEYYCGGIAGGVVLLMDLLVAGTLNKLGRKAVIEWLLFICGISCWAAEITTLSEQLILKAGFLIVASGAIAALFLVLFLYTSELFPTCIRPYALCLSTSFACFISLTSPYLSFISDSIGIDLLLLIGTLLLASCLLGLEMPETQGKRLEDFLEEAHSRQIEMRVSASTSNFGSKPNFEQFNEAA